MNSEKSAVFSNCRKLYKDIIIGHTYVPSHNLYVKHFKETDIGEINGIKERIISECKEKGLLSEEESTEILIENGVWSEEQEKHIEILTEEIADQLQVQTKLFIKSQLASVQEKIDEKTERLNKIIGDKHSVTGLTLEKFSEKKSSESIVRLALFKNKKLEKPLHTEKEYDELEPAELDELVQIYSITMSELGEQKLKMISSASFFMNLLMLCKNNPFIFFGKPACELTNFQTEIFSNGLSYKSVLEKGSTPPVEYHADLEKMVRWYESAGHVDRIEEKAKDKDGSTVIGASKEELRMMAGKEGAIVDLAKEAEKKGGNLDMQDFIRLHSKD